MTMPLSVNSNLAQKVGSDVGQVNNISGLQGMDIINAITAGPPYNGGMSVTAQRMATSGGINNQVLIIGGLAIAGVFVAWMVMRKR